MHTEKHPETHSLQEFRVNLMNADDLNDTDGDRDHEETTLDFKLDLPLAMYTIAEYHNSSSGSKSAEGHIEQSLVYMLTFFDPQGFTLLFIIILESILPI